MNDGPNDFVAMFRLWNEASRWTDSRMVLDFSRCNFVRHNGVAFLGGLIRSMQQRDISVRVDWTTIHKPILRNLQQNGFVAAFGGDQAPWHGNSIPYREDREFAYGPILSYLQQHWLGHRGVKVSQALGDAIRGRVWEIYANAFEHANSAVGVFTCGQLYPKKAQLCLCVADFGEGIPAKVARFRGPRPRSPSESLRWAFQAGNTTELTGGKSRGMGLDLLRDFVSVNDGQLTVYSGGARAVVSKDSQKFEDIVEPFKGTIVDIRLKCDESFYVLTSEISPDSTPYF